MIIDIHTHLSYHKLYSNTFLLKVFKDISSLLPPSKFESFCSSLLKDENCKEYLMQMEKSNITKAVLLLIDDLNDGVDIQKKIKVHVKILKLFPDKFYVFAGIDPRRKERGLRLLKKCVYEHGFKGLKLYPPLGYSLGDAILEPYFDFCNSNNLPVLIHGGPSPIDINNEYLEPDFIEDVSTRYDKINFILAHVAMNLDDPQVNKLLSLNNVYLDISGFQVLLQDKNKLNEKLHLIFQEQVIDKIIFGTDWPIHNLLFPISTSIDYIQKFAKINNISQDCLDKLFYKNALKALGN